MPTQNQLDTIAEAKAIGDKFLENLRADFLGRPFKGTMPNFFKFLGSEIALEEREGSEALDRIFGDKRSEWTLENAPRPYNVAWHVYTDVHRMLGSNSDKYLEFIEPRYNFTGPVRLDMLDSELDDEQLAHIPISCKMLVFHDRAGDGETVSIIDYTLSTGGWTRLIAVSDHVVFHLDQALWDLAADMPTYNPEFGVWE